LLQSEAYLYYRKSYLFLWNISHTDESSEMMFGKRPVL
jgi:hypothetical protein